jgi:hypothetical protein
MLSELEGGETVLTGLLAYRSAVFGVLGTGWPCRPRRS